MRADPNQGVLRWLGEQPPEQLHLAAFSIGEFHFGLELLPPGHRRRDLRNRFDDFVRRGFASRILAFDARTARTYGEVAAERRGAGRPISVPDAQIAATARIGDLAIVTRNTRDFELLDLAVVNPFEFEVSDDP